MTVSHSTAFLTMADLGDFVSDDELAAAVLRERGWAVDFVPWDAQRDWSVYDLVVIRTTWDYFQRPQAFIQALTAIERSTAVLHNDISLVRWNLDKGYLTDLQKAGVPVVPSRFATGLNSPAELAAHFLAFDSEAVILKPVINAGGFDTFLVPRAGYESFFTGLHAVFAERPYVAQPFMPAVQSEGEYSLIYLDGVFCHAILKTPAAGDFRAQEEYGSHVVSISPSAPLLDTGRRAIDALDSAPLYARVDLVRADDGTFLIMEFELIEPSLYLRMDASAPERFANALANALTRSR